MGGLRDHRPQGVPGGPPRHRGAARGARDVLCPGDPGRRDPGWAPDLLAVRTSPFPRAWRAFAGAGRRPLRPFVRVAHRRGLPRGSPSSSPSLPRSPGSSGAGGPSRGGGSRRLPRELRSLRLHDRPAGPRRHGRPRVGRGDACGLRLRDRCVRGRHVPLPRPLLRRGPPPRRGERAAREASSPAPGSCSSRCSRASSPRRRASTSPPRRTRPRRWAATSTTFGARGTASSSPSATRRGTASPRGSSSPRRRRSSRRCLRAPRCRSFSRRAGGSSRRWTSLALGCASPSRACRRARPPSSRRPCRPSSSAGPTRWRSRNSAPGGCRSEGGSRRRERSAGRPSRPATRSCSRATDSRSCARSQGTSWATRGRRGRSGRRPPPPPHARSWRPSGRRSHGSGPDGRSKTT